MRGQMELPRQLEGTRVAGSQDCLSRQVGRPRLPTRLTIKHCHKHFLASNAFSQGSAGALSRQKIFAKTRPRQRIATAASSESANPVVNFWAGYQRRIETDPVPTKALTSFLGFVIGDFFAQKIEGGPYNILRCLRLGTYGLLLDGPIGHWWYTVLDANVEPDDSRSTKAVLIKTAADQLVWAPIMTCVFFAVLRTLEGHPELVLPTIQDKLIKTVAANYVIWPAAHFINFRFVPSEQRILYNNVVSVIWTAYLSTLSHVPIVNVDDLGNKLLETQTQLFDSLPGPVQDQAARAGSAARLGLSRLPSLESLLSPGQHYGVDLTIPSKIEIRSPRMAPASMFMEALGSFMKK